MRPARPWISALPRLALGAFALAGIGCENLSRFDTGGTAAYCGAVVGAQFIRTTEARGGFRRDIRLSLTLHASDLSTAPGEITTDDASVGPCAPQPTFLRAPLRVTQEINNDALSTMSFDDGQVRNVITWAQSSCRGPMQAIVSLYKNDHVEVRLLKPGDPTAASQSDAFALFQMSRSESGCGF
jgi:hypothetical protein